MNYKLTTEVCRLLECSPTALANWLARYPTFKPAQRLQTGFLWTQAEIDAVREARSGGRPRKDGSRVLVEGEQMGDVTMGKRLILNSAVIDRPGTFRYDVIDLREALRWLHAGAFESHIGYPENAEILSNAAGMPIAVSRQPHEMTVGDEALVMRLPYRVENAGSKAERRGLRMADFELGILRKIAD